MTVQPDIALLAVHQLLCMGNGSAECLAYSLMAQTHAQYGHFSLQLHHCFLQYTSIPDNPDLYEHLTGYQYINFIADIYRVSSEERRERVERYGDLFEMTPSLGKVITSYSHGMKQRTAIIAALVHAPSLLILDEPFVGLDPKGAFHLKQIMQELVEAGGAIFFSTHVLDVAEKLCSRIAIIKEGRLVVAGDTDKVKGDHSLESVFMEVQEHE